MRSSWRMNTLMLGLMVICAGAAQADQDVPSGRSDPASERRAMGDDRAGYEPLMQHMQGIMQHMRGMMRGMQGMMDPDGRMGEGADDDELPWGGRMGHAMKGYEGTAHSHRMLRKLARLTDDLGLSEQQERQMRDRLRAHMKQAIQIRAELAIQRIDLLERLDAETVEMTKVKALLQRMAARRADLHFSHLSLMQEIKALLTPEQQEKFSLRRGYMMHGDGRHGHGDWRAHGRMHRQRREMRHGMGMGRGMGMGHGGGRHPIGMPEAPAKER